MLLAGVSLALIMFLSLSYFEFSVTRGNLERSLEVMVEQKEMAFKKMLELSIREIETLCRDWAFWDDTYDFIDSRSEDYMRSNLVFETFVNSRINLMVFSDRNGEVVFAKFYDSEWNEMEISPILTFRELYGRSGYLMLNGSLLILASEQIKRSDGSGEPKGYLLMGRILNKDEIGEIGEVLGLKAEFVQFAGAREFGEKLVSYLELEDLIGNKAFLRLEQENPLYSFYINNLLFTIGFFALISFLMVSTLILIVEMEIVSDIEKLEEFAKKAKTKDRLELRGTKEVESLAKSMNSMLERIEKDEEELRFLLSVLRHDLMNALTSVKGFLELYRVENEPEFLDKAEKSLERGIDIIKVVKQLEAGEMKEFEIRRVVEELSSAF
jgi:sensor domain CHASE-containing protein